jgi:hypothetical protein
VHVDDGGERLFAVRQRRRGGRFVRHEGAHLLRMPGHQRERVDRSAAAGEDVRRLSAERGDQPVQVVRVLIPRGLGCAVGPFAAHDPARVAHHHHPVPEILDQGW